METMIRGLDDLKAIRILDTIAGVRLRAGGVAETGMSPELGRALREEFDVAATAGTISEGDLAREALVVLADDPDNREAIAALIKGPTPRSFDAGATLAVITAALVVLQTHVHFERDKGGKWRFKVEKKPTSEALLKPLVQKILGLGAGRT